MQQAFRLGQLLLWWYKV